MTRYGHADECSEKTNTLQWADSSDLLEKYKNYVWTHKILLVSRFLRPPTRSKDCVPNDQCNNVISVVTLKNYRRKTIRKIDW